MIHGIENVSFLPICFRTLRCSLNDLCSAQNGNGEQAGQHEDVSTLESQSNVRHSPFFPQKKKKFNKKKSLLFSVVP